MPPISVVRDVLATPNPTLPVLTRIVETPVFAADGTLSMKSGYTPSGRVYYAPADGFFVPEVSARPSAAEIIEARCLLSDELLGDFPFTGDAERAHATALVIQPFVRELIDGPTPFYLVEKPSPGTGATLLVDIALYPAVGRTTAAMTEGRDEDEWRKRVTAKLLASPTAVVIDNLRRRLDCSALSAAITSTAWEDRMLKSSETVRIPVRCAWIGTGNNPALSNEMARRTVRIRIDAKTDEPWRRNGFRHPDIRRWARDQRPRLVWAALTLGRAWLAEGRPQDAVTLGMFEEWAKVMGGILLVADIPGFLTNLDDLYESTDDEMVQLRSLMAAWRDHFGARDVSCKAVLGLIDTRGLDISLGDGTERSRQTRLGRLLRRNKDRRFSDLTLRHGRKKDGIQHWTCV